MRGLHFLNPAWIRATTATRANIRSTRSPSFNSTFSLSRSLSTTTTTRSSHPTNTKPKTNPTIAKMSRPKTQEPAITATAELPTSEARWITLRKISYTDQTGAARTWEVASRKTRAASAGVDAVAMGNVILHPSRPAATVLVIQYRPPLDAYTIEWPAGLVDEGETAEGAAVREFKEETGWACEVVSVSPVQAADPGLSDANMKLVMVEVKLGEDEGEELPVQRLEDGEHIQRVVVPLAELYERLVEYSKQERTVVAAKLFHFAAGMEFAKQGAKYGL